MWIGHFKVWHKNCIYLENSSKYDVVISMYPLTSYKEGKYVYHTNVNILTGKNIDKFIKAIKKDKRCLNFSGSGNVYLSHLRMDVKDFHTTNYYTPKIFLLKPIVHKNGKEDWYFGAWEKETITELYNTFKKHFNVKMLSIKEQDFTDLFIPHIMPKITEKQKLAIHLAIMSGYYEFPRKTDLSKLAKMMNVSRVTYQEHLRKAERKLIPQIFGYSK
jgi:predicted DNA binding protein